MRTGFDEFTERCNYRKSLSTNEDEFSGNEAVPRVLFDFPRAVERRNAGVAAAEITETNSKMNGQVLFHSPR